MITVLCDASTLSVNSSRFSKERKGALCPQNGPTLPESPNALRRTSGDWLELIPRVEPQFLNSLTSAIKSSPARDAVRRVLMCMCLVSVRPRGRFCDATVQTEGMWVERMSGCENAEEKKKPLLSTDLN